MAIDITVQIKMSLEESALEDALEEYDELTVSEMIKQVLDKAVALEDVDVNIVEGPNSLEDYDKVKDV